MSRPYAAETSVSAEKSRAEIEAVLRRHGATQFASGWDNASAYVGFAIGSRLIRFTLRLPDPQEKRFRFTPRHGWQRSPEEARKAWEQACRSSWRALLLVIKAKLEAVQAGITTVEDEFLAWTVLPGDGRTVAEAMQPQIAESYATGKPARLQLTYGT